MPGRPDDPAKVAGWPTPRCPGRQRGHGPPCRARCESCRLERPGLSGRAPALRRRAAQRYKTTIKALLRMPVAARMEQARMRAFTSLGESGSGGSLRPLLAGTWSMSLEIMVWTSKLCLISLSMKSVPLLPSCLPTRTTSSKSEIFLRRWGTSRTVQKWVVYTPFCPMAPAGIVEGHARGHKVFHADPVAPPCQADTRRLRRNRRLAVNSRPLPSRIRAVVRRSMTMAAPPPIPVRSRHRSLARRPGRDAKTRRATLRPSMMVRWPTSSGRRSTRPLAPRPP